jgi:hypothetical protein
MNKHPSVGADQWQAVNEGGLVMRGFVPRRVGVERLNITHDDPNGLGPFCRLRVDRDVPLVPGVYAWTVKGAVKYVGRSAQLAHVVHGARMGRAYNDYTYVPASKVRQRYSPRVRVNGLLNRAIGAGAIVRWWWTQAETTSEAVRLEAELIDAWGPPWNRARGA